MQSITLNTKTREIKIYTPQNIETKALENIREKLQEIVDEIIFQMNFINVSSALYKINTYQANYDIKINEVVKEFLEINEQYWIKSKHQIPLFDTSEAIDNLVEFSQDGKEMTKKTNWKLKSNILLTPYLIDKLSQQLVYFNLHNFFISSGKYRLAYGPDQWETKFPHPIEDDYLEIGALGIAMCLEIKNPKAQSLLASSDMSNPFYAPDFNSEICGILTESDTCMHSKIVSLLSMKASSLNEVRQIANSWNAGITILKNNGEIIQST